LEQQKQPSVGDTAPDFTLKDQDGTEVSLSGLRGKRIILSFHPLAWTAICAEQMKSLEEHADDFSAMNTVALGISVDAVPSKKAWAEHIGIGKVRLLSDFWPHGSVAKAYGIFLEKRGFSGRANIIIDENGAIAFYTEYEIKKLPDIQEVIDFLKKQQ
jgi:peroxiredoxin